MSIPRRNILVYYSLVIRGGKIDFYYHKTAKMAKQAVANIVFMSNKFCLRSSAKQPSVHLGRAWLPMSMAPADVQGHVCAILDMYGWTGVRHVGVWKPVTFKREIIGYVVCHYHCGGTVRGRHKQKGRAR